MKRFSHNHKVSQIAVVTMLIFSLVEGLFAPLTAYAAAPVPQVSTYSNPGSYVYTVPAGAQSVRVQVWGAGGSAGNSVSDAAGNHVGKGGGAGGYAESTLVLAAGSTHSIVVGQGGQATLEDSARNGGDSSFGQAVVATGGIGGDRGVGSNLPTGAVSTHCEYEGTWVYNDDGSGNDFAITCRSGAITGFCQADGIVHPQLNRGYHPSDYSCETTVSQTPANVACDFEGTWTYNDDGSGNDFALSCRNQRVTGFCGATPLGRGYQPGVYACENGGAQANQIRCDFDGSWSYNDDGSGNDFAFTCRNNTLTGMCALTPLQRGGPQTGNYVCETFSGSLFNQGGAGGNTGGFGGGFQNNVQLNLRTVGNFFASAGSAIKSFFAPAVAFADMIFNGAGGQGLQGDILMTGASGNQSAGGAATNGGSNQGGSSPLSGTGENGGNGQVIVTATFPDAGNPPIPPAPNNQAPTTPAVTWVGSLANSPVTFTAVSTDPDGDQISYGFDWNNDGIADVWTASAASGVAAQASNTFNAAGSYPIRVFARDINGNVSTAFTGTVVIAAAPVNTLVVTINATPASAVIAPGGIATVFVSSIVTGNTNAITHHGIEKSVNGGATWTNAGAWNSPVANVTRSSDASFTALVLNAAGTYQFRTYTSQDNGATYTYSANIATVTVTQSSTPGNNAPAAPTVTWTTPAIANAGVTFTAVSTDPDGDQVAYGFDWDNDGTVDVWTSNVASGVSATATHTFATAGNYPIRVFARDINGNVSAAFTGTVVVTNIVVPPGNNAPVMPTVSWNTPVTINNAVTFTVTSTDPDGDQVAYGFDFNADGTVDLWTGLGNSGVSTTTTYTYTSAGNNPIQVFARDSFNALSPVFTGTVIVTSGSTGGGSTGGSTGTSGGGGGTYTGPCFGFNCPGGSNGVSNDVWITIDSIQNGGGNGSTGPELVCPIVNFLTVFMRKGIDNNPNEVRKLQYFLNTHEGSSLTLSGDFDDATEDAVKAFQSKYSEDVLSPWGTSTPTGIVYITTTRKINQIYCAEHPGYNGNADLSDTIIDGNVLNSPDNSGQFDGVIGQATSTSSNIAGVFGAITQRLIDALKALHLYEWLILLLLLLATGFIIKGTLQKDIASYLIYADFTRGLAALIIASVLNVLNTMSFMLSPGWLAEKVGLSLPWVLGLDIANLVAVIIIALAVLMALYAKVSDLDKGPSGSSSASIK